MVLNTAYDARLGLDRLVSGWPMMDQRFVVGWGQPQSGQFVPRANCAETAEAMLYTIELPGVELGDLSLQFQGGYLVLSGVRRPMVQLAGRPVCFDQTEGRFGAFRWSCPLPANVHPSHVRATLLNGLLYIEFGKVSDLALQQVPGVQIAIHGHDGQQG